MGLAGSGLPVGKNGSVVSLEYGLNRGFRRIGINAILSAVLVVDVVKTVALPNAKVRVLFDVSGALPLIDLLTEVLHYSDGAPIRGNLNHGSESTVRSLSWQRGSHTNHHFEIVLLSVLAVLHRRVLLLLLSVLVQADLYHRCRNLRLSAGLVWGLLEAEPALVESLRLVLNVRN